MLSKEEKKKVFIDACKSRGIVYGIVYARPAFTYTFNFFDKDHAWLSTFSYCSPDIYGIVMLPMGYSIFNNTPKYYKQSKMLCISKLADACVNFLDSSDKWIIATDTDRSTEYIIKHSFNLHDFSWARFALMTEMASRPK